MNSLLAELNRLGVAHATTEDVFIFVDRLFQHFSFLFQVEESGPRRLELVASVFEHLTVECVNDILDACSHPDMNVAETSNSCRPCPSPVPSAPKTVSGAQTSCATPRAPVT